MSALTDAFPGCDLFVDQEGIIWDLGLGKCPRCTSPAITAQRVRPSGYFRCADCGFLYDEPDFVSEAAYLGDIDDYRDREIVFSLDHLAGQAWEDELWYRMQASSLGSEQEMDEIRDMIDNPFSYLVSAEYEMDKILDRHGLFVDEGNVYRYTDQEA